MYLATLDENINEKKLKQLDANSIYPVTTKNIKENFYKEYNLVITFEEFLKEAKYKADLWKISDFSESQILEKKKILNSLLEKHKDKPYIVKYLKRRLNKLENI